MMEIKKASVKEASVVAQLAIQMWDDNSVDRLERRKTDRQARPPRRSAYTPFGRAKHCLRFAPEPTDGYDFS